MQTTTSHVVENHWNSPGWSGWRYLAERLRPDKIGSQEGRVLRHLLDSDRICARCLELLCDPRVVSLYCTSKSDGRRGEQDRSVLLNGILPLLQTDDQEEDRIIDLAIRLADAYEQTASLLETAFNGLGWGLAHRGGQAKPDELANDKQLQPLFRLVCRRLLKSTRLLREFMERIPAVPQISDRILLEPLDTLASEAMTAAESSSRLLEVLICRHRKVQSIKGKGLWIDSGERWTLMPGSGLATDSLPQLEAAYLHAFRVPNAYSFLSELGLPGVEVPDEEV